MRNVFFQKLVLLGWIALAVILAPVLAAPALAIPVLTFQTGAAGPGGTLTVTGTGVTGSDILLDVLVATGTSADGAYDLTGGGAGLAGSTALLNFSTEPGTGVISVVGGVPALFIPDGTVLLAGNIAGGMTDSAFVGTGTDLKSDALLAALGIAPGTVFSHLTVSAGVPTGPGIVTAVNSAVINQGLAAPTPEPASLLLLGSGLAGLVAWRRWQMKG